MRLARLTLLPIALVALTLMALTLLASCARRQPTEVPGLRGKPKSEAIRRLGPPDRTTAISADASGPLQARAVSALPTGLRNSSDMRLQELRWQDGDYHTAVFVARRGKGEWFVVDSMHWHKEAVFE
ncbi:MAG: hypothetical protein AB8H80_20240 [Planctomycetota bacterium]